MTFEEKALAAGGHLADDVASVMVEGRGTKTIDVPEATIRLGVLFGLMHRADDGVHELTEKGETYFRGWLKQRLASARLAATLVLEDPALD